MRTLAGLCRPFLTEIRPPRGDRGAKCPQRKKTGRCAPLSTALHDQRQMTPSSFPTLANFSRAKSRSSLVWIAEIITRILAFPLGTVG